jgi:hypothetical protein
MLKNVVLVLAFVFAVFTGYVFGQKDPKMPPIGPHIFTGDDFGFQVDLLPGRNPAPDRGWVTGRFVVKIDGQWVEARLGGGVVPIR